MAGPSVAQIVSEGGMEAASYAYATAPSNLAGIQAAKDVLLAAYPDVSSQVYARIITGIQSGAGYLEPGYVGYQPQLNVPLLQEQYAEQAGLPPFRQQPTLNQLVTVPLTVVRPDGTEESFSWTTLVRLPQDATTQQAQAAVESAIAAHFTNPEAGPYQVDFNIGEMDLLAGAFFSY